MSSIQCYVRFHCSFSLIGTTDQLGRAVGLPDEFLSDGEGGGVIQGSASEATLVAVVTARTRALKHMRRVHPGLSDYELMAKMTLYTSDQVSDPAPCESPPSSCIHIEHAEKHIIRLLTSSKTLLLGSLAGAAHFFFLSLSPG